jgi:hypothetical protein
VVSSRCIPSGVVSPACSASCQPFLRSTPASSPRSNPTIRRRTSGRTNRGPIRSHSRSNSAAHCSTWVRICCITRSTSRFRKRAAYPIRSATVVLGRFLQVDPVEGGAANRYDYANQDPVNAFDYQGTYTVWHAWHYGSSWRVWTGSRHFHACSNIFCAGYTQSRLDSYPTVPVCGLLRPAVSRPWFELLRMEKVSTSADCGVVPKAVPSVLALVHLR